MVASAESVKRDVMRMLDLLARRARQAAPDVDLVRLRERLVWAAIHFLAPPGDDDDVVRQRVEEAMVEDKDVMVALTGEAEGTHEYSFRGDCALRPAALIFERDGAEVYRMSFDTAAEAVSKMEHLAKEVAKGNEVHVQTIHPDGDQLLLPGCSMVVETTDGPPHTWIRLHEGPE